MTATADRRPHATDRGPAADVAAPQHSPTSTVADRSTTMTTSSTTDARTARSRDTTPPPPSPTSQGSTWSLRRVLATEAADELRAVVRSPVTLFFSVALPVGFFVFFTALFGGQSAGGTTVAAILLATYGTFGVMGTAMITPGLSLAEDRERGWLRTRMVSATPLPVLVAAKVIATIPHALAVMVLMTVVAVMIGGASLDPLAWLRLVAVLVVGSLPFALLGVAVGALASSAAASAVLQATLFVTAIGSGLWFPLEMMPGWLQAIAPFLLPYHLSQLGIAQIAPELVSAGSAGLNVLVLVVATAALGGLATWALRRARS